MKALSGREFARILERHGWTLPRVRGSHHVFGKPGLRQRIVVPIHGNHSLRPGMVRDMLKDAGLVEGDLD